MASCATNAGSPWQATASHKSSTRSSSSSAVAWKVRPKHPGRILGHRILLRYRQSRCAFRVWWVSPDSNRDAPKERSALQAGAANRIRLTPKLLKNFGGEPGNRTQSRGSAWHVSSVLAYHLPRSPLAPG